VAKYFAIIPAMFMTTYPALGALNIMAPAHAAERHPRGGHLQRAHHHRARAAGAAWRQVPPAGAAAMLRPQLAHLRRRRHRRAVSGIWAIDQLLVCSVSREVLMWHPSAAAFRLTLVADRC
jgi:hypothetical protein